MKRIEESHSSLHANMVELEALLGRKATLQSDDESADALDTPAPAPSPAIRQKHVPSPAPSPRASRHSRTSKEAAKPVPANKEDASGATKMPAASSSWAYLGGSRYRDGDGHERVRPSFFIRPDHQRALAVLSALGTPLGEKSSEVVCRALDLLGINGSLGLPGMTLPDDVLLPDRLIDGRQWEDLLRAAEELCSRTIRAESTPDEVAVVRLNCVSFLLQEALYEAGYGDARRRRKSFC